MKRLAIMCLALAIAATAAAPAGAQQPGADVDAAQGREAGRAAGASLSGGWFAKGLAGGLIGGPIGTGIAFSMAGRSAVDLPAARAETLEGHSALYSRAFREAYEEQRRMKRKESAFVGGMLGTAVWTWMILRAVDLIGGADFDGGGNGEPPPQA